VKEVGSEKDRDWIEDSLGLYGVQFRLLAVDLFCHGSSFALSKII